MGDTPEIKIQIDEDALRAQVREAIGTVFNDAAIALRQAADALDGGRWWKENQEFIDNLVKTEVKRALASAGVEGKASNG